MFATARVAATVTSQRNPTVEMLTGAVGRIHDAAFRGDDLDAAFEPVVPVDVALAEKTVQRHGGPGNGGGQGAIHRGIYPNGGAGVVEAPCRLCRSVSGDAADAFVADAYAVHIGFARPFSVGQSVDEIPNLAFCEVDRSAHDVGDKTLAALVQQVVQPVARDIDGADLRPEIQRHRVGCRELLTKACSFSTTISPRWTIFMKNRGVVFQGTRVDAEAAGIAAADIRMMQHIADPHKCVVVTEQRTCDDYVVLVQRAQKQVVGHEDIAVLDTLPVRR